MTTELDAVAAAIFNAEPKDQGVESRWRNIPEAERDHYRRLAWAAIDTYTDVVALQALHSLKAGGES